MESIFETKIKCGHCSNDKWFIHEIIRGELYLHEVRCLFCGWCDWI